MASNLVQENTAFLFKAFSNKFFIVYFSNCSLKSNFYLTKEIVLFMICVYASHLKLIENASYFILKALFVLKMFNSLSWLFGGIEKTAWLERWD